MKKNKMNGFTLIELLTVIVILAIIALIATPIVLGIINDTKENAVLRSADNYLGAVEQAVMKKNMESGGSFNPSICRASLNASLDCDGEELILEIDGETPSVGKIVFQDRNIANVNITYENKEIIIGENGSPVFLERI